MQQFIISTCLFMIFPLYSLGAPLPLSTTLPFYYEYGADEEANFLICTFSAELGQEKSTQKKCTNVQEAYFDQTIMCPNIYNDQSELAACQARIKREGPVVELTDKGYCYVAMAELSKKDPTPKCKEDKHLNAKQMEETVKDKFGRSPEVMITSYMQEKADVEAFKCQEAVKELASLQQLQEELEIEPGEKIGKVLYDIDAINGTIGLIEYLKTLKQDLSNDHGLVQDPREAQAIEGLKSFYWNFNDIQDLEFRVKQLEKAYKSEKNSTESRRQIIDKASNLKGIKILENFDKTLGAKHGASAEYRKIFSTELQEVAKTLDEVTTPELGRKIERLVYGVGVPAAEQSKLLQEIRSNQKFLGALYLASTQLSLLDQSSADPAVQKDHVFLQTIAQDLIKTVDQVLLPGKKDAQAALKPELAQSLKQAQKRFHGAFKRNYPSYPVEFETLGDYAGKNLEKCQELSVGVLGSQQELDQHKLKECLLSMSNNDFNVILSTLKNSRQAEQAKIAQAIQGKHKKLYHEIERNKHLLLEIAQFHCENHATGCQETDAFAVKGNRSLHDFVLNFNDVIRTQPLPLTLTPRKRFIIKDKKFFMEKIMYYLDQSGSYSEAIDKYLEDLKRR